MPLPKPFKRPSIDLGAKRKSWKDIPVHLVVSGDIIQDYGQVSSADTENDPVILTFMSGKVLKYADGRTLVYAFTE